MIEEKNCHSRVHVILKFTEQTDLRLNSEVKRIEAFCVNVKKYTKKKFHSQLLIVEERGY